MHISITVGRGTCRHSHVKLKTNGLGELVRTIINLYLTPASTNIGAIGSFARAYPESKNGLILPILLTEVG